MVSVVVPNVSKLEYGWMVEGGGRTKCHRNETKRASILVTMSDELLKLLYCSIRDSDCGILAYDIGDMVGTAATFSSISSYRKLPLREEINLNNCP